MVLDKIFINNATQISLSDRFTMLQTVQPVQSLRSIHETYDTTNIRSHSRLTGRLGMTPMARAAMQLKRVPLKQRIGKIKNRLPNNQNLYRNGASLISPGRGRGGLRRTRSFSNLSRGRRRSLSRSNSLGSLNRSASFNDLSGASSSGDDRSFRPRRQRWRGRDNFRYRGQNRGANNAEGGQNNRGQGRGRGRGRGRGKGRGRGRGGFNTNNQQPPPNREDLDRELDLYMAGSKTQLDRELDTYMVNAMDISY